MTLIRVPQSRSKLHETEDRRQFSSAMEQMEEPRCEIWIQGSHDERDWFDLALFWSGRWSEDLPVPSLRDVVATVAAEGLRFGRHVVRSKV